MANLVNGLGGSAGFGENAVPFGDDNSSGAILLTGLFPSGIELSGASRTQVFINTNGNLTFGSALPFTFGPPDLNTSGAGPVIAPFWSDVDTRTGTFGATPGGTSTGSNTVFWDLDAAAGIFTVTWDDVGRFANDVSVLNAFQLRLIKATDPTAQADDFQIEFRYEIINWSTTAGGFGNAVAGIGDGSGAAVTLPQSGNNALMLDLENQSNVGEAGRFVYTVRNGVVQVPGAGSQVIAGTSANERLDAQSGNDTLYGLGGNDTLVGAQGNDLLDGGAGFDVADYSALGARVTLAAGGLLTKDGLGVDTLGSFNVAAGTIETFERVIGAVGFANVLDNSAPGPIAVNVDLAAQTIQATVLAPIGGFAAGTNFGFEVVNFRDVIGSLNSDTIRGDGANNTFFGSRGNDILLGRGGFDVVDYSALGARVTLAAGGLLTKDGGFGVDTLGSFNVAAGTIETFERVIGAIGFANVLDNSAPGPIAVNVDLAAQTIQATVLAPIGGFAAGTNFGFEVVNFRDVIGSLNSDTIRGDGANNTFFGSRGNDTYDGLTGTDTIDYTGLGQGITLRSQGVIQKTNGFGTDTIANMETIIGDSTFANTIDGTVVGPQTTSFLINLAAESLTVLGIPLIGSAAFTVRNFLNVTGTANADTITGNNGNNAVIGAAGNDFLSGGQGDDSLRGGTGNDSIDGGAGIDTASYFDSVAGVTVDLLLVGPQNTIGSGFDTLVAIENLSGGLGGDTLRGSDSLTGNRISGNDGNDLLEGRAGNDVLLGGNGNDTLRGGFGDDTIDGGAGVDLVSFFDIAAAVRVDLALAGPQNTQAGGFDTLIGIENASGGGFGDVLSGNAATNTVSGNDGNDLLEGRAGNDTLLGGNGNDTLRGGVGDDTIDGGAGVDLVSFFDIAAAVRVDLALAGPQNTQAGGFDTLISIENASGGGFGDVLFGNSGVNTISGNGGNDLLDGRGGDDILQGGDGDDTLAGDLGNDTLNGGNGFDRADYRAFAGPVTLDLLIVGAQNTVAAGFDTLIGIEWLSSGNGNDTLRGSNGIDRIGALGGNDIVEGRGGNDILFGGPTGSDRFIYRQVSDATNVGTLEEINEFGAGDLIDLELIDTNSLVAGDQDFVFIGAAGFTAGVRGQLRYTGGVVLGETTGDAVADFAIRIVGSPVLNAASFDL